MAGHTSCYVLPRGVTPVVTRSQTTRQNQTPVVTDNQENNSLTSVAIAERFRLDTQSPLHELGLFSTEAHDTAHQKGYQGKFFAEYTYVTTNLQIYFRGREKERTPNTLKKSTSLPKAAHWKENAERNILSLEKHEVYKLGPVLFVPSQKIAGTRWGNQVKADGTFKSRLVVQMWSQASGTNYCGTPSPVCRLQSIRMVLAIMAELD